MTVERMIKNLEKMNPKAVVRMHHRDGEPVLFVMDVYGDEKNVWLESESDNDMSGEIEARFESAIEGQTDGVEFYKDLLEIGIDVDMVRKHIGNQTADTMQKICKKYGLI